MSALLAARQALAEQQISALRDWLGEDQALRYRAAAGLLPTAAQPTAPATVSPPVRHKELA